MAAPKEIVELVARFEQHREAYTSGKYNETQLRREFLDPFFTALGWDVANKGGNAEAYKDVVHEDQVKVGALTKAPDYSFRIGGSRKFFVEAKKPSVNVKDDPAPAFQLRRYAWSAKLPLGIVTDFEEFAVYDCRIKPGPKDKAGVGRALYLTFRDYAEKWDEIAAIFSKEAILKGSFDRYASQKKRTKGTAEVDAAFLEDIERWRDLLARNLAGRNPSISQRGLNFAVQSTIDRIIFLRICEDRGIEHEGRLLAITNGPGVYGRLLDLYRQADERYNSGLFHFREEKGRAEGVDRLTPSLAIDDKVLREIIGGLYPPESPYEFSVLPADILGQVYEQFLGKVIRLTAGHQAKVEEKPEVKKAGGVYYTPTFIVEYIVRSTVDRLLAGRTPAEAAKLRIVDPACGSGSFLIVAYQHLLDRHRDWYIANDPEKWAKGKRPTVHQGIGGEWRLTTAERKRILLNNIFGVDIDSQAVEVTKLSLLLKVLEGETEQTLRNQFDLFHQRALPDLGGNIRCGNSLIGSDYYDGMQMSLLDDDEQYRVNVFDWPAAFPDVFKAGGFDAVIGNPPYVRQESLGDAKQYLKGRYAAFDGVADLYVYFIEKGVRLLRQGGFFGYIVSSGFLRTRFAAPLRAFLKDHVSVDRIVDFGGLPVFANAKDTYVCIPLLRKGKQDGPVKSCRIDSLELPDLGSHVEANSFDVPPAQLTEEAWSLKAPAESALFAKVMQAGVPLGESVGKRIYYGIKTGLNEAFVVSQEMRDRLIAEDPKSAELIHPLLTGEEIRRYTLDSRDRHLIAMPSGWTRMNDPACALRGEPAAFRWLTTAYPAISRHLSPFADAARKRQDKGEFWWELRPCAYYECFDQPKIIFPDIAKGPRFVLDTGNHYLANTAYFIGNGDTYLLGILNSRLSWFVIGSISIPFGTRAGQFRYRLFYQYMEQVPIRRVDFSDKADKARHDRMVMLVEQMIALQKRREAANTGHEQTVLSRQIDATDRQIDALVYELYDLTDEEIALVEGSSAQG